MKKIFTSLTLALILILLVASPAFAWGSGDADTEVVISDVTVVSDRDDGETYVGSTVTVSGLVTIKSESEASGFLAGAFAESDAEYSITNPKGVVVAQDSKSEWDFEQHLFSSAEADASQPFTWETTITLDSVGYYDVSQIGEAIASAWKVFGFWYDSASAESSTRIGASNEPHDIWGEDDGRLRVVTQSYDSMTAYHYTDLWGNELREGIDQSYNGLRLVIPAGTVVGEGFKGRFLVKYSPKYGCKFEPKNITFSRPATLYYNGEEILTFTEVVDGEAQ